MENDQDKGKKNGRCNRTACGSRRDVVWYNRGSQAYYCEACAVLINRYRPSDMAILCVDTTTLIPRFNPGDRVTITSRFGMEPTIGNVIEDKPHVPMVLVEIDGTTYGFDYDHLELSNL